MTVESRVFPPYLQSACVLHEKAFLINRPAPLEFDKNRGEKDLINPQSFQFGVFCMSEVCFLQRSQAWPVLVYRDNILPFVQLWFAPSLPGEVGMKRFSEVISSTACKGDLDSHADGGYPRGERWQRLPLSLSERVCSVPSLRVEGLGWAGMGRTMQKGMLKVKRSGMKIGWKGESQRQQYPVWWAVSAGFPSLGLGQRKPSLPGQKQVKEQRVCWVRTQFHFSICQHRDEKLLSPSHLVGQARWQKMTP